MNSAAMTYCAAERGQKSPARASGWIIKNPLKCIECSGVSHACKPLYLTRITKSKSTVENRMV